MEFWDADMKFLLIRLCSLMIFCFCFAACGTKVKKLEGSPGADARAAMKPDYEEALPGLAAWKANMNAYGKKYCNEKQIQELSTWEGSVWYYDGMRVYYQIADYTGDPEWEKCAGYVKDIYRKYVLDSGGKVGAWRVFPHGLFMDYQKTGDQSSRQAVLLLANSSPFAAQGGGAQTEMSRETAYLIHAYLHAEKLGQPEHPMLKTAFNNALGHIDQWFIKENAGYMNPFMAALTSEALIAYHDAKRDPRAKEAVKIAADYLWEKTWNPANRAFPYVYCQESSQHEKCKEEAEQGADLNLLISPMYAWLYKETADPIYAERADAIFENGVRKAWLGGSKQFSQNYRWSIDHVNWRLDSK